MRDRCVKMTPMRRLVALVAVLIAVPGLACGGGAAEGSPTPGALVGTSQATAKATVRPRSTTPSPTLAPTRTPEPTLVSLGWLAADVSVPGLASSIAAPLEDRELQAVVEGTLAGFGGSASVVVENLQDGRYAAANGSQTWYAASTFKAAILLTAYQQRDAGLLDFDKVVTLEDKYTQYDLGTLDGLGLRTNDQVTVRDAIKGMIVVSDTSLAALMQDQVGGNNVDATLRDIGATVMTVNSYDLPTTALDLAHLMIAITAGQSVSAESRDEMLSLLAQEWYTQGIVAGLPAGTQYAHKSGSYGAAVHDAGIVWGPAGPYVIVVMTDGSGGWTPIADVSAAVWDYFASGPSSSVAPEGSPPTDAP
jgi:beta-lactamase class A